MTRLFDLPHAQVQEFLKGLAHAGLTGEQMLVLTKDRAKLGEWVSLLSDSSDVVTPSESSLIDDLFPEETKLVRALGRCGVTLVRDLEGCSREELLSISNIGEVALQKITKKLEEIGLSLSVHGRNTPDRVLTVDGVRALRRDQLNDVLLRDLIALPGTKAWYWWEDDRNKLTIGVIKQQSDEDLGVYFKPAEIQIIRKWIADNAW